MALYEKSWWKKIFQRRKGVERMDALNDIQAVKEYLQDVLAEIKKLHPQFKELEELEKEFEILGSDELKKVNLETQAEVIEKIVEQYEFFQNDIDINGLRVKKIAHIFLKRAQKAGLAELVNEKKQSQKWKMQW